MLSLKNINLTFDRELIKNGELYVPNEQLTVLFGPSGSGKSSLLYDMAFLTKQVQMDYIFDGIDVHTLSQDEIKDIQRNQIAFVFQNIPLFDSMNLMENIRFFSSLTHDEFDENQARQYLTDLELYLDDQTPIEHLSGGERQRLAIICALMKDTPYIFMDEPTAYLDEDNRQEFLKIIDLLKNGDIDLGFVNMPLHDEAITIQECLQIHDIFVSQMPDSHIYSLSELSHETLVMLEKNTNSRQYVDDHFALHGHLLHPDIELGSHNLLLEAVKNGLGKASNF